MDDDQQATRVLALRHGETDWNVNGRIQGQLDVPLNAMGRWQAYRLARALAGEDFAAIYSSDLSRTMQTAEAVSRVCGRPIVPDPGLRERGFGIFEGMSYAEIEAAWPIEAARWRRRDPTFGAPGGEVLDDFYRRCVAAATRLAMRHPGQTVALVAHGGVMDCLYRAATHVALDAPRSWQLGNAAINRLLWTPQGFSLVGWSDIHHLSDASLDDPADADAPRRPARPAQATA